MSKRSASYDIDQRTFQEKDRENNGGIIDPQGAHMIGRKIYKITKHEEKQKKKQSDKIDLKIDGLFNNKIDQININGKLNQKQATQKSIFNNEIFKESFSKNIANIFQINNGVGLFNEKKQNDKQGTKNEEKKSLFGDNSYNIFSNNKPIQAKASIFGNNDETNQQQNTKQKKSVGLFDSSFLKPQQHQNQKGLLFAHLFNNDGNSTFNNVNSNKISLFGNIQKGVEPQAKVQQNDYEADSQQLQKQQEMSIDPSKATKQFDYKEELKILKTFTISKFKKEKGQLIQNLIGNIAFDDKLKSHLLIIKMPATKLVICSGLIVHKKSLLRKINEKVQNLQMTIFTVKSADKKNQIEPLRVKIQISSQDSEQTARECYKLIEQIIEGKSESK